MRCLKAEVGGVAHSGAPAESPDSPTLMYLCLAPSSQPGRDVLGSSAAHQMTSVAHPRTKLCGQRWRMKQRVDVLRPRFVQDAKTQLVQALHYAQLLIP